MGKRKLIVVSHTHWDREWYLPFEEFRMRLVEMMDRLLDVLDGDGGFRHFTLDGQDIVLEDYLEARPDRLEDLRRHISAGRLLVGPWYVLSDEFLVSPEALIRNLLRGLRLAKQFGQPMRVGYVPDTFGHIAQLPQILRGFGIESAVLWRGVGSRPRQNEFLWRSRDGSEVLAIYLSQSYDNAAALPENVDEIMERLALVRRELEPRATTEHILLMNGDDHAEAQASVPSLIAAANARLKDAELIHGTLPQFLDLVRRAGQDDRARWETLEGEFRSPETAHILAGVLSTRMWIKQRNAASEVLLEKWAEPFAVFADLARAEPGRDGALGSAEKPFLRLAWGHLLRNHPHDSICGCSVDQVHEEMRVRFDRTDQIAGRIAERSLDAIAERIDTSACVVPRRLADRPGVFLVVFNPIEGPRTDFVTATLAPPCGAEDVLLADSGGDAIPSQTLSRQQTEMLSCTATRGQASFYLKLAGNGERWRLALLERALAVASLGKIPRLVLTGATVARGPRPGLIDVEIRATDHGEHDYQEVRRGLREIKALLDQGDVELIRLRVVRQSRVEVGFVAADVPARGYRVYEVLPGHRRPDHAQPTNQAGTLENEYFAIRVDAGTGGLSVIDKETRAVYSGLNVFVDGGDSGDEYSYSPPPQDIVISGPLHTPRLTVLEQGPARWQVQVEQEMALPAGLTEDRVSRSTNRVICTISTRISLYPGVRRIDFVTEVDNLASDHRLRVRFPTRIRTDHCFAETPFEVTNRPVNFPEYADDWLEAPNGGQPQRNFVDVSDGTRGLLVANRGLPEYDVEDGPDGTTIYLTLLRCVGWLSRDDLSTRQGAAGPLVPTPGAQCQGKQGFHYALIPHSGDWQAVFPEAHRFAAPMRARTACGHSGPLPPVLSFLTVEPSHIVVSAVKPAEEGEGFIVRLFNPTRTDASVCLALHRPLGRVRRANLDEETLKDLPLAGRTLSCEVKAGQVVTLRLNVAE